MNSLREGVFRVRSYISIKQEKIKESDAKKHVQCRRHEVGQNHFFQVLLEKKLPYFRKHATTPHKEYTKRIRL